MRRSGIVEGSVLAVFFAAMLLCPVKGAEGLRELIFLDPICQMDKPRNLPLPPGNPDESTQRMAERLRKADAAINPMASLFFADRTQTTLSNMVARATNLNQKAVLTFKYAFSQLLAGRPDFALNTLGTVEPMFKESGSPMPPETRKTLGIQKSVAFMRLGERENCIANSNADSCLFPFRPDAYHKLPRGSRAAIKTLKELFSENTNDLGVRWLLNVAHMTLGEYPDQVPPDYLIDPKFFASEYDMPRFPDVAGKLGLNVDDLAGGMIVDDFDNDGFLDMVVSSWDLQGQLRFFKNNGNGTFTQRTSEAGLVGITGGLNLQQTDYNNDGFLDVFVTRGAWLQSEGRHPKSLLRNNGNGTFTDVTEEAGLLSPHPTQACEWFDFDGDGWLDLFIGHESTDPRRREWSELYRNNRDGTFTECAKASGITVALFVKGVTSGDYDNDGRPDLYLSCRNGPNLLFHNDGPQGNAPAGGSAAWKFTEVTQSAGVAEPFHSFPTCFFDYDNDGWVDILCTGYDVPNGVADVAASYLGLPIQGALPKLYRNNGNGTFTDVTEAAKLNRVIQAMGLNIGDLDNDGWLDFYAATGDPDFATLVPNRMFRNAGGKFFQDVTTATGTGHLQKGHGVSFADIDNDGDQDVAVVMGGAYTGDNAKRALFLNPGSTNGWLNLKLVGVRANRAAIGARAKISVKGPSGSRNIFRTVTHGASFGANTLRLEVGLGEATEITDVEVRWPGSGAVQMVRGLKMNRAYEIREGIETATERDFKKLNLTGAVASTKL